MPDDDAFESEDKASFGACSYVTKAPAQIAADTTVVKLVLTFEEALKLNVAIGAAVQELTRKNRGTPEKRRAGVKLIVHLNEKKRIRVHPGKTPLGSH